MAHSSHKRWHGCALCKPFKIDGQGRAIKDPVKVVRVMGRARRIARNEIPQDQLYGDSHW